MRKYEITSANTLVRMSITFQDLETGYRNTITADVDYLGDRVYFQKSDREHETGNSAFDYAELEAEILASLRPSIPEQPQLPPEIITKIKEVQSGNYAKYKETL